VAAIARAPTPRPTNIRSTILYKAAHSIPTIAGQDNLPKQAANAVIGHHVTFIHFLSAPIFPS
jgi:hypothetical protein